MKTNFFHINPYKVVTGSKILLALLFVLPCLNTQAQLIPSTKVEKNETRKGNKQYDKDNYTDAEASYKKALDKKNNMPEAMFNLGDAVYKQKRYDEAMRQFELSSQTNPDTMVKAKAMHNLGNTYMEQQKWEDAVRSYKNALRFNPNDKDTKYNLAYANAKLRQQQNDQKNKKDQKKDDKNKKDKDKDKQDQDKQKQNQRPDQKQDQKPGDDKQPQKGPKPQLSRQDAEKLLDALNSEEQKTNDKMHKPVKVVNGKVLKDW